MVITRVAHYTSGLEIKGGLPFTMGADLVIKGLHVSIGDKEIIKGLT